MAFADRPVRDRLEFLIPYPAVRVALPIVVGIAVGALSALHGRPAGNLTVLTTLPLPALIALIVVPVALVIGIQHPWFALGVFFAWSPFEDLARKLAGNDLRVYLVKEILFAIAIVSLARRLHQQRAFVRAVGPSRVALYALLAWALALSVPAVIRDPRLPVIGLRLDFMYIPLAAVGFTLARDRRRLYRALRWLGILGAFVLLLGIIQAIVGPQFLSPSRATPGLNHLVLERFVSGIGPVYRPTGTFVDPGRYSSMTLVVLTVALAANSMRVGRRRSRTVVLIVAMAVVAVWLSGARAGLVGAAVIVIATVVGSTGISRTGRHSRILVVAAFCIVAIVAIALAYPEVFSRRTSFYAATLDPRSSGSEWAFRWHAYARNTISGVRLGGLFGRGTGTQALGLHYLYGGEQRSLQGLYVVESGWGTVGYEWGAIGLGLWVGWSVVWWRRLRRSAAMVRGSDLAPVAATLSSWIFFLLFVVFFAGKNYFQNYVSNAYFWLLSGVVFGLPHALGSGDGEVEPAVGSRSV